MTDGRAIILLQQFKFNLKLHNNNNNIESSVVVFFVLYHQQYRFVCDFRRKVLIAKQNFRCAGCGTKIEQGYLKRFRYCEYLGKYFCHCCHTNSTSVIPAKILHKWDFSKVRSIIKYENVFLGGFLGYYWFIYPSSLLRNNVTINLVYSRTNNRG